MVQFDLSSLRQTQWYEYAVRFLFGGLITAATGIIARKLGPGVGGLFLAFPRNLPRQRHLDGKTYPRKEQRTGRDGHKRARGTASLDAAGAATGSVGLAAFALFVWWLLPLHDTLLVLTASAVVWFALAVVAWQLRRLRHRFHCRRAA